MLPGDPLDEHYALLSVVVTSSRDGALPQHCSFIGPNLELKLQSHQNESSQSQSKDSLRYLMTIEHHGATQVRALPATVSESQNFNAFSFDATWVSGDNIIKSETPEICSLATVKRGQ